MQSEHQSNDITNSVLTNQNDCKDTWDSDRSKPNPLDKHGGHTEGENDYIYSIPNCHELNNQDNPEDHETYPHQLQPEPSKMPPLPCPSSYPSEAFEKFSFLPVLPLLLLRKDDIVNPVSLMNMVCPIILGNAFMCPQRRMVDSSQRKSWR